jgi:nitrogen regulatory protein PII
MKLIIAYIQKFMCEQVTDALREAHVHGMTIFEGSGVGHQAEGDSDRISTRLCVWALVQR